MANIKARPLGLRFESMVSFQNKDEPFFKKVDELLTSIRGDIKEGYLSLETNRAGNVKTLEKLINDRFKINTQLVTTGHSAAVVPFFGNDNHVLMKEFFRDTKWLSSEKEFIAPKETIKGTVDLATPCLGGDYTRAKSTLYLNFNKLMSGLTYGGAMLTNREIIAVMLHELGHIFYPLAFIERIDRTNLIFEQAVRDLKKGNADKRKILSAALSEINKKSADRLANDVVSDNPIVATKAVMKILGEATLQHQSDATYTETNFEMLADNFAVRFGYGAELVTSLEKMMPGGVRYGDIIVHTSFFFKSLYSLSLVLLTLVGGRSALSANPVGAVLIFFFHVVPAALFLFLLVRSSGEASRNWTYDDLVVRYSRIRSQMIASIKERSYTKTDAARLIENIDTIGGLIKEGRNWRTPIDLFFNTFNPADRRAKDSIERQQALELLINNDLFLASLKVGQLVK